jgi:hypothetical protein
MFAAGADLIVLFPKGLQPFSQLFERWMSLVDETVCCSRAGKWA